MLSFVIYGVMLYGVCSVFVCLASDLFCDRARLVLFVCVIACWGVRWLNVFVCFVCTFGGDVAWIVVCDVSVCLCAFVCVLCLYGLFVWFVCG